MFVRGLNKVYPGMGLKYVDPNREEIAGPKESLRENIILVQNNHLIIILYRLIYEININ